MSILGHDRLNSSGMNGVRLFADRKAGLLSIVLIVLGLMMIALCVAVFRLHSDLAILGAIALGAVIFFSWFVPIIRFVGKHTD